jgi:putative tributyrin esterase
MCKTLFAAGVLAVVCAAYAAEVKNGVAGGNVGSFKFLSESLGEERAVNILLPADYNTSWRRYPALYLLHGLGDDHTAWAYMTNLSGYAAKLPMIVVMPDAGRSFYVNSASDPKARFEDFIAKDLIAYVDSHYRTIPLRRSRAVAGLSMGGYGAALLGLKYYRKFAALGAFSGVVGISRPTPMAANPSRGDFQNLFGASNSPERAERDPFALLEKIPAAEIPDIYIACGGQDGLVSQNRDFVKLLAEKKIPYEYRELSPRAHTWDLWDDQIRIYLARLSKLWN